MAKIDDPAAWILQLFLAEEREGRGADCERLPEGIAPPDLPLGENERVYGIYKSKYYFTPQSLLVTTQNGFERIPWAMVCNCTSRHGEGRKTTKLTLLDGRTVKVKVGDFSDGWSGRISQLFHQMIERWGAKPIMGPQPMAVDEFFQLGLTEGSIGCNLSPHPGLHVFRQIIKGLSLRDDIEAMYALVSEPELDDGVPFTDTILVFGTISVEALQGLLRPLGPDKIGPAESLGVNSSILPRHQSPTLAAWWD